jgi:hypothetical protein
MLLKSDWFSKLIEPTITVGKHHFFVATSGLLLGNYYPAIQLFWGAPLTHFSLMLHKSIAF